MTVMITEYLLRETQIALVPSVTQRKTTAMQNIILQVCVYLSI